MAKNFSDHAFFIRQEGLPKGFAGCANDEEAAEEQCVDKNARAKQMGLAARYEVIDKATAFPS